MSNELVTAGIDAEEIEYRERFNLVMKILNGVSICVKANLALRMIENDFAVHANYFSFFILKINEFKRCVFIFSIYFFY